MPLTVNSNAWQCTLSPTFMCPLLWDTHTNLEYSITSHNVSHSRQSVAIILTFILFWGPYRHIVHESIYTYGFGFFHHFKLISHIRSSFTLSGSWFMWLVEFEIQILSWKIKVIIFCSSMFLHGFIVYHKVFVLLFVDGLVVVAGVC